MEKLVVHPSPIHFKFETSQNCFFNTNLFWMGGRLSIYAVVYSSNTFYAENITSFVPHGIVGTVCMSVTRLLA